MRTHRDHIQFFAREIQMLGSGPMNLSYMEALEALANDGLPETEAACRVFSETLKWPAMTNRIRFEVCLRLECARWYCTEFSDADEEDEEWSGSEFLQDLLVEYWHEAGHWDWLRENYCLSRADWNNRIRSASGTSLLLRR